MKKIIILSISLIVLSSCKSNKDEQFCNCMKASEELNEHSLKLFEGNISKDQAEKQQEFIKRKKEACKKYETMTGAEMMKRKQECEEK